MLHKILKKIREQNETAFQSAYAYGTFLQQYKESNTTLGIEEYSHKLKGYLTALVDVGLITQNEMRELFLYFAK